MGNKHKSTKSLPDLSNFPHQTSSQFLKQNKINSTPNNNSVLPHEDIPLTLQSSPPTTTNLSIPQRNVLSRSEHLLTLEEYIGKPSHTLRKELSDMCTLYKTKKGPLNHFTPAWFFEHGLQVMKMEEVKEADLSLEEVVSLLVEIEDIGQVVLQPWLYDSCKNGQFSTITSLAYTGLVKLAKKTYPVKSFTYEYNIGEKEANLGKMAQDILVPDASLFCGAVSRAFVHSSPVWDLFKDRELIFVIEEREEDEAGLHNGIHVPFHPYPAKKDRIYPPLTTFWVKKHYEEWNEDQTKKTKVIVVDPLYRPIPHLPCLIPSETVWYAVRTGNTAEVLQWMSSHPSVNLEAIHPNKEYTLLYCAVRFGQLDIVRSLVEGCAYLNSINSPPYNSTPLHAACFFGYNDIAKYLIDQGANPNIRNSFGLCPYEEAISKILPETIQEMVNIGESKYIPADSKLVGNHLIYGDRLTYLQGISGLLGSPKLTPEQEFSRNITFHEKYSGTNSTLNLWNNALSRIPLLSTQPQAEVLTHYELMVAQLYTGPCYKLINNFLRSLITTTGEERCAILNNDNTWAATVLCLNSALRKLSSLETDYPTTYRGIDMSLAPDFFVPDPRGMIAATEFGFMSTSEEKSKALEFCGVQKRATLFCVRCHCEDAAGHHMGASLEWCTMVKGEKEILFPPMTLFEVTKKAYKDSVTSITVTPTFI